MIAPKANLRDVQRPPRPLQSRHGMLRLDMNEHLGELPPELLAKLALCLTPEAWRCYPEYHRLYPKLAAYVGLREDQVLLTNGSDSAAKLLFDTYVAAGDRVLMASPTFAMHKVYAGIAQAQVELVSFRPDFTFPLADFLARIVPGTRVVIVVTPNNPTGYAFSHAELEQVARATEAVGALCYFDEAYIDFHGTSFAARLAEFPHVLLTRTFSKAFGFPSLRLGYAMAHPEIIRCLRLTQPFFDVNTVAAVIAECLLDQPSLATDYVAQVDAGSAFLQGELRRLGLRWHVGCGNFMLIDLQRDPGPVMAALKDRAILVSPGNALPEFTTWIRITLGPPAVMGRFATALADVLADSPVSFLDAP